MHNCDSLEKVVNRIMFVLQIFGKEDPKLQHKAPLRFRAMIYATHLNRNDIIFSPLNDPLIRKFCKCEIDIKEFMDNLGVKLSEEEVKLYENF